MDGSCSSSTVQPISYHVISQHRTVGETPCLSSSSPFPSTLSNQGAFFFFLELPVTTRRAQENQRFMELLGGGCHRTSGTDCLYLVKYYTPPRRSNMNNSFTHGTFTTRSACPLGGGVASEEGADPVIHMPPLHYLSIKQHFSWTN